jgi:WD40 repeat protein/serine/threonine protein kinase
MAIDSSSDRDPVERLAEEFFERRRRGEAVTAEDYAARHPEWAERIREMFPALLLLENLKPGSEDRTGTINGSTSEPATTTFESLGDYRILREVGRGGMGVVYEAIQESLGRHVALKVLPLHGRIDPIQIERFRLEARSAARLHHTHIVPVHGVGVHEGVHYYAMQFIQGHGLDVILDDLRRLRGEEVPSPHGDDRTAAEAQASLAVARSLLDGEGAQSTRPENEREGRRYDRPHSRGLTPSHASPLSRSTEPTYYRAVVRLCVQVAEALAHAHAQGVLHRDIKPSNLLLDADGSVWITDFGLAKLEGSDGPTRTGDIVGTLRYMAPERFEGWSDPRSDVYGLGITLYELLTLRPAFEAATRVALIERVVKDSPVPPRRRDARIPRDLETIVLKAITKEPGERYATAQALAQDLNLFLEGKPIRARRTSLPEQAWRWCRRSPLATALAVVSMLAVVSLVGLGVGLVYHAKLESVRYFNNILLAESQWNDSNSGRAEQLLDDCVPRLRGWEWHYLKRQCHTDLMTIPDPPTQTQAMGVAFSPDGRHVAATGYEDNQVRIWDRHTGVLVKELRCPTADALMAEGLAYSPDGKLLATTSGSALKPGAVIVWDAVIWKQYRLFPGACGQSANVAFSPDGERLAAVSGEWRSRPKLTIWNVKTGEKIREIEGAAGEMGWIGLSFSPDGRSIATASGKLDQDSTVNEPGTVQVWNSWSGDLIRTLRQPSPLTSVAYSPDGTRLATTAHDRTLRIWDSESGKELATLRGHNQVCFKVAFSPDGKSLATVSEDNSAKLWDAVTLQERITLRGHKREVHGVAFSRDSLWLATASMDRTIKIWDATQERSALTIHDQRDAVLGLSFDSKGRQIAAAGTDATVRIYDADSGRMVRQFVSLKDPIWSVAYSPESNVIATGSGHWLKPDVRGQITLWDTSTGEVIGRMRAHAGLAKSVAFSPDGKHIASAGGEHFKEPGVVKVWDTATGAEILRCEGHSAGLNQVAYSPDGQFLASTGWDNLVIVWDPKTGRRLFTLKHQSYVITVAFNAEGTRLASAGMDGVVRVWSTATGQQVYDFRGHKSIVWCLAFSPDGSRAVSGGDDGTVKVWDATTGQEALTLRGHQGAVMAVAFSPDGHHIASASKDGTVKIWDGSP